MPIYEYQCQACGDVNEVMQKFDAAPPAECEKCHKGPLAKLLSKTAFVLKGTGWYVTDFRGGNDKKPPASEGSSAGGNDKKPAASEGSSGGGDAKPAATETKTKTEAKTEAKPAASTTP